MLYRLVVEELDRSNLLDGYGEFETNGLCYALAVRIDVVADDVAVRILADRFDGCVDCSAAINVVERLGVGGVGVVFDGAPIRIHGLGGGACLAELDAHGRVDAFVVPFGVEHVCSVDLDDGLNRGLRGHIDLDVDGLRTADGVAEGELAVEVFAVVALVGVSGGLDVGCFDEVVAVLTIRHVEAEDVADGDVRRFFDTLEVDLEGIAEGFRGDFVVCVDVEGEFTVEAFEFTSRNVDTDGNRLRDIACVCELIRSRTAADEAVVRVAVLIVAGDVLELFTADVCGDVDVDTFVVIVAGDIAVFVVNRDFFESCFECAEIPLDGEALEARRTATCGVLAVHGGEALDVLCDAVAVAFVQEGVEAECVESGKALGGVAVVSASEESERTDFVACESDGDGVLYFTREAPLIGESDFESARRPVVREVVGIPLYPACGERLAGGQLGVVEFDVGSHGFTGSDGFGVRLVVGDGAVGLGGAGDLVVLVAVLGEERHYALGTVEVLDIVCTCHYVGHACGVCGNEFVGVAVTVGEFFSFGVGAEFDFVAVTVGNRVENISVLIRERHAEGEVAVDETESCKVGQIDVLFVLGVGHIDRNGLGSPTTACVGIALDFGEGITRSDVDGDCV